MCSEVLPRRKIPQKPHNYQNSIIKPLSLFQGKKYVNSLAVQAR